MLEAHEAELSQIWRMIFDVEQTLSLDMFMRRYSFDIQLTRMGISAWNKQEVTFCRPYQHVIAQSELEEIEEAPLSGEKSSNITDILRYVLNEQVFCGSNSYESSQVIDSDNIFRSTQVFASRSVFNSKNVLFSANVTDLESCAACDNSGYSQFCIRAFDSGNSSRSFEIYQSDKCSNSFFISNSCDLRDCILCWNLKSKRYCIGNCQYSEAEYQILKKELLNLLIFGDTFVPMYSLDKLSINLDL